MQIRSSVLLSLALGTILILAPSLADFGSELGYDQALAAKGGNGKGKSAGQGNAGNSQSAGKSSKSTKSTTDVASVGATKQKSKDKQLALSDPTAPAHPSMLGRWNAAKPIDHPAIQAHIRNGKFNGTIGMVAAYAKAQSDYNSMEADLAAAEATVAAGELAAALDLALKTAGYVNGYADLQAYTDSGIAVAEVDAAMAALGTQAVPTPDELQAAQDAIDAGEQALDDLAAAEANMEAFSNRSPWSDIRDDVRVKMGLDPTENDLEAEAPETSPTTP
jgi:hypothetical protein